MGRNSTSGSAAPAHPEPTYGRGSVRFVTVPHFSHLYFASPFARFCSAQEILAIAERIRALVERERIIKLKQATGWLVESAVRAYAAQPNRPTVMEIICGIEG